jgi:hypothetical protein
MHTTTGRADGSAACEEQGLLAGLHAVLGGSESWAEQPCTAHVSALAAEPPAEISLAGLCQDLLPLARAAAQYLRLLGLHPLPAPRLHADDLRYLAGPLIVFDPAWGEDTPAWLLEAVRPARLGLLLAGEKELASEEEAVIYLMSASLAQPLDHDWCQVFLHLAGRVLVRFGHAQTEADFWDMLGEEVLRTHPACEDERLRRLRSWLRRQVTRAGAQVRSDKRARYGVR